MSTPRTFTEQFKRWGVELLAPWVHVESPIAQN